MPNCRAHKAAYTVQKINKRLFVLDGNGSAVYSPPDFIRFKIKTRSQLQAIADKFNALGEYDIRAIMEFERGF